MPVTKLADALFNNQSTKRSNRFRIETDPRMLTRLRTLAGYYSRQECRFVGSPATPAGPNHDVRYESIDFHYRRSSVVVSSKTAAASLKQEQHSDADSTLKALRDEQQKLNSTSALRDEMRLHRIHHIGGMISSLYLVEYRRPSHAYGLKVTSLFLSRQEIDKPDSQALFMLDGGTTTDITRVETAMRHVLNCPTKNAQEDPHFVANLMHVVNGSHVHADHCAGCIPWACRGVPVTIPPGMPEQHDGFGGKVQYLVETLGANFYASYLKRSFPEWTFFSPRALVERAEAKIIRGGDAVPVAPFGDWINLQCPGHTVHMNVMYHPYSRTIYVADMFQHNFGKFRPPIPVDRLDCYLQSLDMLRDLPVKHLLMAHGGAMELRCDEADAEIALLASRGDQRAEDMVVRPGTAENGFVEGSASQQNQQQNQQGLRAADVPKMTLEQYFAELGRTRKMKLTFREICDLVAERAKKQVSAEAKEAEKKMMKNLDLVLPLVRKIATSSPAPKRFVWERDMPMPEKQLEAVAKHVAAAATTREQNGPCFGQHKYEYTMTERPVD